MLIDNEISGDRNVIKKEAEKILKYKDLTIEIEHMWNVIDTSNNRGDWDYLKSFRTYQETMKSRNYRKQPYWAPHTYFRKY
jgi:hypothetical protein